MSPWRSLSLPQNQMKKSKMWKLRQMNKYCAGSLKAPNSPNKQEATSIHHEKTLSVKKSDRDSKKERQSLGPNYSRNPNFKKSRKTSMRNDERATAQYKNLIRRSKKFARPYLTSGTQFSALENLIYFFSSFSNIKIEVKIACQKFKI